ncbi:MAG: helix-turn-helix domain-containing protein [Armatimonadetes bacterium]|nr:helix-turn-helix domain-containing protein [Armatimonadota bacterium]
MTISKADLITHPIRARILMALMGRELTTQQVSALLPDVPRTSLYRYIRLLANAGVLSVVREIPVRGTLEKVFALAPGGGELNPDDIAEASGPDQLRYFATLVNALSALFYDYVRRLEASNAVDGPEPEEATYGSDALYLSEEEYQEWLDRYRALVAEACAHPPGEGRRRRIAALIVVPDTPDPPIT